MPSAEGEHIGLVGRNGSGKSTFLQIAAGVAQADSGEFTRRRDLVTGYMPQLSGLDDATTVHANILSGAQRILDLIIEYERAPVDSPLSATLLDQIGEADGWNLEHRIKSLITNLHAPESDRVVGTLSGGEKRRVALCRALLARPDFLILDEPTNHLDTGSIEWLEDFLARYAGTCLFVTHDRYFLDRVATRIVELSRGEFTSYDGNYTDYLLARAQRQAVEEAQEHQRQKFLKRELQWVRKAPRARRTKSVDRVERYFEMAAQEAPEAELDVELIIPTPPKLANRIIELRDVSCGIRRPHTLSARESQSRSRGTPRYCRSQRTRQVFAPQSHSAGIARRERCSGDRRREPRSITSIKIGSSSTMTKTVWEEVGSGGEHVTLGEESITLRAYLRRFLFSEDRINTKISQLSGGERSRVLLAKILKRGGNVLMLDEPTNDLDLGTLRLLEEALVAFGGCVIVVSHDRYFLNRVCTSILAFEGEGRVAYSVGNYDYYLEKRGAPGPVRDSYPTPAETAAEQTKSKDKPRKLKWKEEREWESMEANILSAENEVSKLEATFAAPDFYAKPRSEIFELETQLKTARDKVAHLYARWQELELLQSVPSP